MFRVLAILAVLLCWSYASLAQSSDAELILEHGGVVRSASWNADESRILTADSTGTIRIWSAEDGEKLLTIKAGGSAVAQALWALDDAAILSADESGRALLSQASDGETIYEWQLAGLPVALELNRAGTAALVFTRAGFGALLSLEDGGLARAFEAPVAIGGAAFSADERRVRAWSEAGRVYDWEIETGEERNYALPQRSMLLGLQWSADDTRLLAWFTNGAAQVYETDGMSIAGRAVSGARHRSFVKRAIWSADETRVMSWAGDDTAHIWSAESGESQRVLRHDDWVIGARWDDREERVLSWSHIYVYLWDEDSPRRLRHGNLVNGALWSNDGARILSWSWDGTARIWRT